MEAHQKEIKRFLKLSARAHEKNNLKEESECCNALGNEYFQLGEYDDALSMHEKELALCKSLNDRIGQAVANRKIGDVYSAKEDFTNAIKHHYKYLELAENNNVELQRATTSLGKTYLDFSRSLEDNKKIEENLKESIEFLNRSLRLTASICGEVQEREIVEMKIRSLINLGLSHHQLSGVLFSVEERTKSENYFQKAIYLSQKHNFKEDLYLAYYVITSVNLEQKQLTNALRNCQSALSIAEKIGNQKSVVEALILNGQVDLLMGNIQGAKSCYLKAYKKKSKLERGVIEEQLKYVIKLCQLQENIKTSDSEYTKFRMHENMADILCRLQCFDLAVKHYKQQENLLEEFDPEMLTEKQRRSVYFSIASTLYDVGEYNESKDYHLKELEATDVESERSKTWSYIAACYEKAGEGFEKVGSSYESALQCARAAGDKRLELKTLSGLVEARERFFQPGDSSERERMEFLEEDLGMLAEDSDGEMCENSCPMEDDLEDLLREELEKYEVAADLRGTRRNPKLNRKNDKGETLLHRACIEGDLKRAESLVGQGHDLSPRDYCGWTPLHEACNYGHYDIIKLLVERGAKVNDIGGDLCQSITPVNDAATNGHFHIVNYLLDNGANPNIESTQGATVLTSLQSFYRLHGDDMDLESKELYLDLCKRLKFKQYSKPDPFQSVTEERDFSTFEPDPFQSVTDSEPDFSTFEPDLPTIKKRTKESRNINSILDHGGSFSGEVSEYKDSIAGLGGSTTRAGSQNIRSSAVKRRSNTALIPEDENPVDDWLIPVEDVTSQPIKKQRVFDKKISQTGSNIASKHRKSQPVSSRINKKKRSSKITDFCTNNDDIIDLDSFNGDFYEEEKTEIKTQPVLPTTRILCAPPQPEKSTFRLKVKIEEITFMVAVTNLGETIGELTARAASKYEKARSREPRLALYTADDCMLSEEDLIVDVLSQNDLVVGKVTDWREVEFSEMYESACKKNDSTVVSVILQACVECKVTKTLELRNIFTYEKHLKPLFSIVGLQDIQKMILSGSRIGLEGVKSLCTSMDNGIKSHSPLVQLNLGLTNLPEESLTHLSNSTMLAALTHLDLSYNPLNDSVKLLTMILKHCKKLQVLNVSHCGLSIFNTALLPTLSKLDYLEELDISHNSFGWKGVKSWLKLLNRQVVQSLNLNAVVNGSSNTKLLNSIHEFVLVSEEDISYLGVEDNYLTADHLDQFVLSSNYFEQISIANNDLDLNDLKHFVNKLPCCNTKWLY